jgi:ferredoxin
MKIRIDTEACTGHGRCYTLAPALFHADDEGFGQLHSEDVPPEREADARRAAVSCPELAVSLEV